MQIPTPGRRLVGALLAGGVVSTDSEDERLRKTASAVMVWGLLSPMGALMFA